MCGCLPSHLSPERQKYRLGMCQALCCSCTWVTRRLPTAEGHSDRTAEQAVRELERCLATHLQQSIPFQWTLGEVEQTHALKGLWMSGAAICWGIHFLWDKDHGRHFYTSGKKGAEKRVVFFLAEERPLLMDLEQLNLRGLAFSVSCFFTDTAVCIGYYTL